MTCIIGKRIKTAYKTFKQFFDSSNILWVIQCCFKCGNWTKMSQ
jgi:hypothetical protein